VKSSTRRVGISKKALRKDPAAILPQFLVTNLLKGEYQLVFLPQYQLTTTPEMQ
jgi:hypothetical protein